MSLKIDISRPFNEEKIREEDQTGSLNNRSVAMLPLDDDVIDVSADNELNLAAKRAAVQQQNFLHISSKHRRSSALVHLNKIKEAFDNSAEYEGWSIKSHKNSDNTIDVLLKATTEKQADSFFKKIQWFAVNGYKIDKLVVTDVDISSRDLFPIINLFPVIRELKLIGCGRIKDETMLEIAQIRRNFQTIDLSKCASLTDKGRFVIIFHNSKELLHLTLKGIRNLTDQELIELAPYLKNLKTLDLSECPEITDVGVKAITEHCKNLEVLNLNGCRNVTSEGLKTIGSKNLQALDLGGCDVSDEVLISIAPFCANLRSLNLHGCRKVTEAGLQAIAPYCANLEVLDVSECSFKDAGIKALADSCTKPQVVNMFNCWDMTYIGRKYFSEKHPTAEINY